MDAQHEDAQSPKVPFDIHVALRLVNACIAPYPKAALFQLFDEGVTTPLQILVACILPFRTRDEVSLVAARRLLGRAPTARSLARLFVPAIDALIADTTFHRQKAAQLQRIAQRVTTELAGELPCDEEVLLSLPGVGPKCAGLVLGIACGQPSIGVDIHVHRVTNRWVYVAAATPERTLAALRTRLPREHRVELNACLVPFGKHVCTGVRPLCSRCPVRPMCRQAGVTSHR